MREGLSPVDVGTNFACSFFDPCNYHLEFQLLMGAVVLFEVYAAIETCRNFPQAAKFLLILIGINTHPFMIHDLKHTDRFTVSQIDHIPHFQRVDCK
ncbi:MAG: hypothetical protein C5B53_13290 [Candidatus Melainabacteria bacterium]|nr:MAG: hypothetical protein C5B53_13290 [Candidatus Melainabacteria bacterium]